MRSSILLLLLLWACDDGQVGADLDQAPPFDAAVTDAAPQDARATDAHATDARGADALREDALVMDADVDQDRCRPMCDGHACGPDGCGGSCGECAGLCEAGRCALPPDDVIISEFLAANSNGPDWVEIQNRGRQAVDLAGWYLTDDIEDPMRWRFPEGWRLAAGEIVVVERGENGFDFGLRAEGEALALVWRDGRTVVHAYAPTFPQQQADISYGIAQTVERTVLVGAGDVVRWRSSAGPDAWIEPDFDDTDWRRDPTGIGFGDGVQGAVDLEELAGGQPARQSSTLGNFNAARAVNGDLNDFTHTTAQDQAAAWRVDLERDVWIDHVVVHNRQECCRSRLRDITVRVLDADDAEVWASPLLNPENVEEGPPTLRVPIDAVGRFISIQRTPDPDRSGGAGNADEVSVLSLAEVEVWGASNAFSGLLATTTEPLDGLQIRVPFELGDPTALSRLTLTMHTDAGFAVWLNGAFVGGHRMPADLGWDSRATAEAAGMDVVDLALPLDAVHVGVNLLAIQALNADDQDLFALPIVQAESIADGALAYFETPTPGAPNDQPGFAGFVDPVRFSVPAGIVDQPFMLALRTTPPDAEIRYTLDGGDPREGLRYDAPLPIDHTTTVRAVAVHPDWRDSPQNAATWVLLDDVAQQTAAVTQARGLPARWGNVEPDYGIDERVVAADPERFEAALRALPTLAIAADVDDLFGPDGIYTHSNRSGTQYERLAAAQLLPFGDEPGFEVVCGLRIQGGAFRNHGLTKKHSLRLLFKGIYGPTKLTYPLYAGADAVERFDTLTLRANSNDGWQWGAAQNKPLYIRDAFGRATRRAMGGVASHGRFVHLYLNGIYWGVYEMTERPDASFAASYFGGDKTDWDALNSGTVVDGDDAAWRMLLDLARPALADAESYGAYTTNWIEPGAYVDYMLANLFVGNTDWPHKNFYAARNRVTGQGFFGFMWDSEWSLGLRSNLDTNRISVRRGIAAPWDALRANSEFQVLVGDRAHQHLFGDGALTPAATARRFSALADQVEMPLVAESARWGDQHAGEPYTVDAHWGPERDRLLAEYFPQRSQVFLDQLRQAGLYPAIAGPVFESRLGQIPVNTELAVAVEGIVYFTLNGPDPRAPGGEIAEAAREGAIVLDAVGPVTVKARLWVDGNWSALEVGRYLVEP